MVGLATFYIPEHVLLTCLPILKTVYSKEGEEFIFLPCGGTPPPPSKKCPFDCPPSGLTASRTRSGRDRESGAKVSRWSAERRMRCVPKGEQYLDTESGGGPGHQADFSKTSRHHPPAHRHLFRPARKCRKPAESEAWAGLIEVSQPPAGAAALPVHQIQSGAKGPRRARSEGPRAARQVFKIWASLPMIRRASRFL